MTALAHFVIVVLGGYGLAVALVEKRKKWPVRRYNLMLKRLLGKVHRRAPKMLDCCVCTSFWAALVIETMVLMGSLLGLLVKHLMGWPIDIQLHWMWPITGFATVGLAWSVIMLFDVIDPPLK